MENENEDFLRSAANRIDMLLVENNSYEEYETLKTAMLLLVNDSPIEDKSVVEELMRLVFILGYQAANGKHLETLRELVNNKVETISVKELAINTRKIVGMIVEEL